MIEKFSFDYQTGKHRGKMILVKTESETRAHVVLKVLAFLLYYDPRLKVESAVGMHYKPDLVIEGPVQAPELWIDCGYVALRKIENLARKLKHTRLIVVKKTQNELRHFRELAGKRGAGEDSVEYLAFENGFIDALAEALVKKNEITQYEAAPGTLGIALNDEIFESVLFH